MVVYLQWVLIGLTSVLVASTVLPLSGVRFGAIRGLSFFRLQFFWLAVVLAAIALLLPQGRWAGLVLAAVALVQLGYIVKFTRFWRRQSLGADRALAADKRSHISLLAANVKQSNRDYDALIALVRRQRPDVVMAVEVDQPWIDALESELAGEYPDWIKVPKDNTYGICVMSRLPLSEAEVREVVTQGVPSVRTAVTLGSGAQVRLYVVHPEPPVFHHDTKGRDSEIAHVGIEAAHDALPAIVTGDLNDVAWSRTTRSFQRLSGLLDPRVGRGFFNTFHAFYWWARWPLDHLFHDPQFRLVDMARLEKIGSDHFPMMFRLALANRPMESIDAGSADPAEQAHIERMIWEEKKRERTPIGSDWED